MNLKIPRKHHHLTTFRRPIVANLFPDMSRESYKGSDDFIFAAPIHIDDWNLLRAGAMHTKDGVYFVSIGDNLTRPTTSGFGSITTSGYVGVTILLREAHHTDDDMVTAGAWLRMTLGNTQRIYAVPSFIEMDLTERMVKTIGAPRELSVMLDLHRKPKET
jgi:hypothetical protein